MSRRLVSVLPNPRPQIMSVGTATPCSEYTQEEICELLAIPEGTARRFFGASGIERRHLYIDGANDAIRDETQFQLLERHRRGSLELGRQAVEHCLRPTGLKSCDVDFLCCVTSTGLMMPGLTAMYIRHLGFRQDCQRTDLVAMGCNAALNGANVAASWIVANPGRYAMVICCEINSAIHVRDERIVTALVNSLFGDGCGAMLLHSSKRRDSMGPALLGFSSHIVTDEWRAISYHWSPQHSKFELYLDKRIPAVLGAHSPIPIMALLNEFELCRTDVAHWLVHAGGTKVIKAVGDANGLTPCQLRHATNVLRQYGNLGSTTLLFSYDELLKEGVTSPGDYCMMVTMGPGATIETALLQWPTEVQ